MQQEFGATGGFGGDGSVAPQDGGADALPADFDLSRYRITFDASGNITGAADIAGSPPAPTSGATDLPQAPTVPSPAPEPQPSTNLADNPDFQRWQSTKDREVASARRAAQDAQAQAQRLQQTVEQLAADKAQRDRDARLAQAQTPLEREQLDLQLTREQLDAQRADVEAQATRQADINALRGHEQVYVQQWGVPANEVQYFTQVAWTQVQQNVQAGATPPSDALAELHTARDAYIRMRAAQLHQTRQQAPQQQPQGQPQQGYPQGQIPQRQSNGYTQGQAPQAAPAPAPVQPQYVPRPNGAAPGVLSLDAMEQRAQLSGKAEDWIAYRRAMGMPTF